MEIHRGNKWFGIRKKSRFENCSTEGPFQVHTLSGKGQRGDAVNKFFDVGAQAFQTQRIQIGVNIVEMRKVEWLSRWLWKQKK